MNNFDKKTGLGIYTSLVFISIFLIGIGQSWAGFLAGYSLARLEKYLK